MDIDVKIAKAKELIAKREEIDLELGQLLGGAVRERKLSRCSICNQEGHTARSCPTRSHNDAEAP
jgi:hypothetical protein